MPNYNAATPSFSLLSVSVGFAINVTASASDTDTAASRVAPLYLFYDTTGSRGGLNPFTQVEYRWDYGDAGSGNWGSKSTGAAGSGAYPSRNTFRGPVAGHVYETAGSYTTTCTATYNGKTVGTKTFSITVTDPDTIFATTSTVVCNNFGDPDFTWAVGYVGATPYTDLAGTNLFATIINGQISSTKKRIILKPASAWSVAPGTVTATISTTGPGIVMTPAGGTATITQTDNSSSGMLTFSSGMSGWRIVGLTLNGGGGSASVGVQISATASKITLLNLSLPSTSLGFSADSGTSANISEIAVHDCSVASAGTGGGTAVGGALYGGMTKSSFQGNNLNGTDKFHTIRFFGITKSLISNNTLFATGTLSGAFLDTKLHGRAGEELKYLLVSGNKYNDNSVFLEPQNTTSLELGSNYVVERNWSVRALITDQWIRLVYGNGAVRNNVDDATTGTGTGRNFCIIFNSNTAGVPDPGNIGVYNNSFYCGDSVNNGIFVVQIGDFSGHNTVNPGVIVGNNCGYAPSATNPAMYLNNGISVVTTFSNSSNANVKSDACFSTIPPTTIAQHSAVNNANGGGTAVASVPADFNLAASNSPPDRGAVNH